MSATMILTVIVMIAVACVVWMRRSHDRMVAKFARRGLRYVSLGNMFTTAIRKQRIELLKDEALKREGPIFAFRMLGQDTVMIADPDIVQTVMVKEFTNFVNRRSFDAVKTLMNESLMATEGERWKRLRAIASPAFSVAKLRQIAQTCIIDSTVRALIRNMRNRISTDSQIQNVKNIFDSYTADTIIRIAFGVSIDSLNEPNHPIIVNGRSFFDALTVRQMIQIAITTYLPSIAKRLGIQASTKPDQFFEQLTQKIIEEKKRAKKEQKIATKSTSFIEIMLEAEEECEEKDSKDSGVLGDVDSSSNKNKKYMTLIEIVANSFVFFLAGFETTSTSLTLIAYQLAKNPDKQERLHREIVTILDEIRGREAQNNENEKNGSRQKTADSDDAYDLVTYEQLPKFTYLNAVIDETLRLDPPVHFLEREAANAIELRNADGSIRVQLERKDVVHVPVWSLHHDGKYFGAEPERFRPERFLSPTAESSSSINRRAYMPFGIGPRNCIGKSLSLIETKLAAIHVVRNFRFEVCDRTPADRLETVTVFDLNIPQHCYLRVVPRV